MSAPDEPLTAPECASATAAGRPPRGLWAMLRPLADDLGADALRILLARGAMLAAPAFPAHGPEPGAVAGAFAEWARRVAEAGWGRAVLLDLDLTGRRARVLVEDAWEVRGRRDAEEGDDFGCPLLTGLLVAAFQAVFGVEVWAEERWREGDANVEFAIAPAPVPVDAELAVLRAARRRTEVVAEDPEATVEPSRELLRERTRQLREEILARERAERAKDELISTVSHELRTPLASLRGFAELLRDRVLPPDRQRRYVDIIHAEALRLSRLIDDFLDLQSLERGARVATLAPMDLLLCLRAMADRFSVGTHTVHLHAPGSLPLVLADEARVQQILANLLANAAKFSPGVDRIELSCRCEGDEVVVGVRDYGIGIPEGALPNLFTKFYRVDNAETRRIGGTGLGLVIVKQMVDRHGGRVWVESREGEGSTFWFTLRVADAPGEGES